MERFCRNHRDRQTIFGEIVDVDGSKYLLLTDCAALISTPIDCPVYTVADEISSDGVVYPVKYFACQAFVRSKNHVELPKYFEKLDLNVLFNSVGGFTFNQGLKEIVPLVDGEKYRVGGGLYMKNEAKLDLSALDSYELYTEL